MEVSFELHASVALPQGKSPCYPFDRMLGGSGAGLNAVVKKFPETAGARTSDHPAQRYNTAISAPVIVLSHIYNQTEIVFTLNSIN
jgi:hypothetical protein